MGAEMQMWAAIAGSGEKKRRAQVAEEKKKEEGAAQAREAGKRREDKLKDAEFARLHLGGTPKGSNINTNQTRLGEPNLGRQRLLS